MGVYMKQRLVFFYLIFNGLLFISNAFSQITIQNNCGSGSGPVITITADPGCLDWPHTKEVDGNTSYTFSGLNCKKYNMVGILVPPFSWTVYNPSTVTLSNVNQSGGNVCTCTGGCS